MVVEMEMEMATATKSRQAGDGEKKEDTGATRQGLAIVDAAVFYYYSSYLLAF